MRHVASYDVSARISYGKRSLLTAVEETVHEKLPANSGGLIALNSTGQFAMDFNCSGMFRGFIGSDGYAGVGIWSEIVNYDLSSI